MYVYDDDLNLLIVSFNRPLFIHRFISTNIKYPKKSLNKLLNPQRILSKNIIYLYLWNKHN